MLAPASAVERASRRIAVSLISFYQRRLSPHKGFCCAHRVWHGSESCSQYAREAVAENGLFRALPLLKKRLKECGVAGKALQERRRLMSLEEVPEIPAGDGEGGETTGKGIARSASRKIARGGGGNTGSACDGFDCAFLSCEAIDCSACACDSCSGCDGLGCNTLFG